jgi:iron complex outermembrane receptor protein
MSNRLTSVSILLAMMAFSPMLANAATDNVAGVEITQQSSTCRGVIIDSQGEPVIGASILVKGTTTGTITDMDGNFEINNVRRGATLVISFVGYKTQ